MPDEDDNNLELSGTDAGVSFECACVGECVGFECIRSRASALLSGGDTESARELLEKALVEAGEHDGLRAELRAVYDVIVADTKDDEQDEGSRASSPCKRRRLADASLMRALADGLECSICTKLLYEPVTTPCGHTFCRACLSRAIDFIDTCPLCRDVLHLEDPSDLPITRVLSVTIQRAFPTEYAQRKMEVDAEAPSAENAMNRLPLFPLNAVVFPAQRFPMHIFEARYRLMLRRIMQGSKKFGLIALKRMPNGCSELCEIGCVLEVTKSQRIPDGRSLIETVARERFRVVGRTEIDGYLVGRTEAYHDSEGLEGEQVAEVEKRAREIIAMLMERGSKFSGTEHASLSAMQRAGSVPTEREGPSALGLWLAGMLVNDINERQRLLEMNNAQTRLIEMTAMLERFRDSLTASNRGAGDCPANRECTIQ